MADPTPLLTFVACSMPVVVGLQVAIVVHLFRTDRDRRARREGRR